MATRTQASLRTAARAHARVRTRKRPRARWALRSPGFEEYTGGIGTLSRPRVWSRESREVACGRAWGGVGVGVGGVMRSAGERSAASVWQLAGR